MTRAIGSSPSKARPLVAVLMPAPSASWRTPPSQRVKSSSAARAVGASTPASNRSTASTRIGDNGNLFISVPEKAGTPLRSAMQEGASAMTIMLSPEWLNIGQNRLVSSAQSTSREAKRRLESRPPRSGDDQRLRVATQLVRQRRRAARLHVEVDAGLMHARQDLAAPRVAHLVQQSQGRIPRREQAALHDDPVAGAGRRREQEEARLEGGEAALVGPHVGRRHAEDSASMEACMREAMNKTGERELAALVELGRLHAVLAARDHPLDMARLRRVIEGRFLPGNDGLAETAAMLGHGTIRKLARRETMLGDRRALTGSGIEEHVPQADTIAIASDDPALDGEP